MKYRTKFKIVLAVLIAFLGGMSVNTMVAKKERPGEPLDNGAYEADFSRACRSLSANTMAVSDLANEVCGSWIKSITLGYNSTDQIEKVFFALEKTGTKPQVAKAHEDLEHLVAKLKDYPFKYREAYRVLEQTYTLYCQLY
ncbi:MAG: hypothetical protein PHT59_06980, partial [Candidatus Omnitrophica bacterium]|nr:hypothetical protein [Candidatus Omnitrophota bacterium]